MRWLWCSIVEFFFVMILYNIWLSFLVIIVGFFYNGCNFGFFLIFLVLFLMYIRLLGLYDFLCVCKLCKCFWFFDVFFKFFWVIFLYFFIDDCSLFVKGILFFFIGFKLNIIFCGRWILWFNISLLGVRLVLVWGVFLYVLVSRGICLF